MQWQLEANGLTISGINALNEIGLGADDFVSADGRTIKTSLAIQNGKVVGKDQLLFEIEVYAEISGTLSSMLSLNTRFAAEAYVGDVLSTLPIELVARSNSSVSAFETEQIKPNPWNEASVLRPWRRAVRRNRALPT